jgi:tellurite resistance protein TerC
MRLVRRVVPTTARYEGQKLFTRENGRRLATPLFAVLVLIELTDVVFAVDSVPAILAVSQEPYLVFASNAFAILGLRAAYFLLAGWRDRLHYLGHGLGAILVFVGIKMALSHWWHMPIVPSLLIITTLLVAAVVASRVREHRIEAVTP